MTDIICVNQECDWFRTEHYSEHPCGLIAERPDRTAQMILDEAHRAWVGIDRGTHTPSDLDEILNPQRWRCNPSDSEPNYGRSGDGHE